MAAQSKSAKRNRALVVGGVGLGVASAIGLGVWAWSSRASAGTGATADIPDLLDTDAPEQLAALVCACIDAGVSGRDELAACVLRRVYAESEIAWPPPIGATNSHGFAWRTMQNWIGEAQQKATAANKDLCAYLRDLTKPPLVIGPVTPAIPKEWDPESEPGFVAGSTFCNDQTDKPYNANVWDNDGEEVVAELVELGYNLPSAGSIAQRLTDPGAVLEIIRFQNDANKLFYPAKIGDAPLDLDGKVGGCTLRVLSFAQRERKAGRWPVA